MGLPRHIPPPHISHLRIFGCLVLVPILGPKRSKMGPQRRHDIYIGFDSPSIIRFLEPSTADVFRARYQNCQFCEDIFPKLTTPQSANTSTTTDIQWHKSDLLRQDPRTQQANDKVQRILQLHQIIKKLPDAFTDAAGVTRSHIEAANTPARIQIIDRPATDLPPKAKRGRPPSSKDSRPRQKRQANINVTLQPNDNEEISVHYMHTGLVWPRHDTTIDEHFALMVSQTILSDPPDPKSVKEAQQRPDWPQWDTAINSELDSLISRHVLALSNSPHLKNI